MRVTFPRTELPPPPRFSIDVPDEWQIVPSLAADIIVTAPSGVEGVRSNVVLKFHRIPASPEPAKVLRGFANRQAKASGFDGAPDLKVPSKESCSMMLVRSDLPDLDALISEHGPETSEGQDHIQVAQQCYYHYLESGEYIAYVLATIGTSAATNEAERQRVRQIIFSIQYETGQPKVG